jgi:anaerobic magnesium-protoporphyrin IX monomethyl ester cyclase
MFGLELRGISMDLLLIDPPRNYWGFGGGLGLFSQPVGLAALAGFLVNQGVEVEILDCNILGISWEQLGAEIEGRAPKAIGVTSSMTCFVPDAFRCLELAKSVNPEIVTLGGGLQFSLASEESFKRCTALDVIVRRDGEFTTLEVMEEIKGGNPQLQNIPGLSFKQNGRIINNPDRSPLEDLDTLPFPAWDLIPMDRYRLPAVPKKWGNIAIVVTTRGCPYQCSFCSPIIGQNPYRAMSAERVLEVLENLYEQFHTRVFWFSDLSFNVYRERTEKILDGIIERGWKVHIALDGTRTDLFLRDRELVPKMKKAGVFLVCLGVESYSEPDLEFYRKGTTLKKAEQAVRLAKEHGINSWCFFMLGSPHHTEADVLRILEYAKELDPTIAIFTIVTPIPGTAFYEQMESQGYIDDTDWARYDLGHPVMKIPHLSRQQLLDLIDHCYTEFYKRPTKIIRGILGDQFARDTYRFMRFVGSARQLKEGII